MSKKFEKLLEAATDSTLLEPNWDCIIACFDSVRSGEVQGKHAMGHLRKRIQHENPHVVMHSLLVLDACVKNCGSKIHKEVATREFMEEFKNLGIESKYDEVKNKVLEMLQCWAMAFANNSEYKIIVDTHNLMKLAGFDFPSIKEADAMFSAQVAPDWQEGSECYRCRTEFTTFTRKHHCRACGQIFCHNCSSKEMTLPQYGIEKEVRVCDACFEKGGRFKMEKVSIPTNKVEPKMAAPTDVSQAEKEKLLREKEEEDLALAIAISKSEAEAKEQERQKNLYSFYNGDITSSAPPANDSSSVASYQMSEIGYKGAASIVPESPAESISSDDPLAKYLNRDYWQQRKAGSASKVDEWAGNGASAPLPSEQSFPSGPGTLVDEPISHSNIVSRMANLEVDDQTESTLKWCQELKENVSVMENRIRSNTARGRPVVNDTAIQGLFLKLTELHAQVLKRMGKLDEDRAYYERLQDHLAHIVDARSAVNELRDENERKRQERLAEEQRLRQAQMKQTLDMMRMKKHAMLLEQRDIALQRFQQQEQEMQARRQQPMGYYQPHSYNQSAVPHNGYQGYQQPTGYYNQYPQQTPQQIQQAPHQYDQYNYAGYYQNDTNGQQHAQHQAQAQPQTQSHQHHVSMMPVQQPANPSVSQPNTVGQQYTNQPMMYNMYGHQNGQTVQANIPNAAPVPEPVQQQPVAEAPLISFD